MSLGSPVSSADVKHTPKSFPRVIMNGWHSTCVTHQQVLEKKVLRNSAPQTP